MAKSIIWSKSAAQDLENIFKYIPNKKEAENRLKILFSALEKLEQFPKNVTAMKDIPFGDYYEMKHASFRIIVKAINADKIAVLTIVYDLYR
jgi:plasmid stabilization system protein ParE